MTLVAAERRVRAPRLTRAVTRRVPAPVLLGALVTVIAALNVLWRTLDSRPPHWDMARHLGYSVMYLRGFDIADPIRFVEAYHYYPPLVYWVTDVFYAVLGGETIWIAILSNVVWLAVLVLATYGIGKRLWNARVGWLSVVFVVTAPIIVSSAKEYMLDMPLTAMAAVSLYLLIRSDGLLNRRYSLLFGVACGCGLLVKWTFPFVLGLPVLHLAAKALADARRRHDFARLVNVAGAAALTFAVAGAWYAHNFREIVVSLRGYTGSEGATPGTHPPVGSLESAFWYLWNLLSVQLYLLPFLFVLVGIGFCLRKRELRARNLYPLLTIVGTYAMFTLLNHKDPRYTMPMLPALAVVATSWLEYVSARTRAWTAAILVSYGVVAFVVVSFGTSLLPKSVDVHVPSTSFGPDGVAVFEQHGYVVGPPSDENWHQADPFRELARFPRSERRFAYRGSDSIWFNNWGIDYFALRYHATRTRAANARFLIVRGVPARTPRGYARLDGWAMPDRGTLTLYERSSTRFGQ